MLLGLCAVSLFVSCQKDMEDQSTPATKSVTLEISVSAEEAVRTTPTNIENAINSVRIYAFLNGKSVGYLYREAAAADGAIYMDMNLPETGTHNVEFYLIANEAEMADDNNSVVTLAENMTKAQLEAVKFTGLRKGESLPMYEKRFEAINVDAIAGTANTVTGHEDHFLLSQKISFSLQRPIAKLSLYGAKVSGMSSDPQILAVEFLSAGTRQYNYLFPQSDATLNAIPSRANNRQLLAGTVVVTEDIAKGDAATQNPANYTEVIANQYFSEMAVGSSSWDVPSSSSNAGILRIEYSLGQGQQVKNNYIYLPALKRNHHIKVCVLFSAEGNLVVNYAVAEWEDNALLDYHFDYPTHSYLMEQVTTTENEAAKPSKEATMAEGRPFKGYFQMTKPSSDAWTPTLLGLNGNNCEIIVYDEHTQDEVRTFPIPVSDKWYRIEVWPLTGKMDVGDEIKLAISYKANVLTQNEFLLINGSNNNFYWPYTGSTAQDANYVIIKMVN